MRYVLTGVRGLRPMDPLLSEREHANVCQDEQSFCVLGRSLQINEATYTNAETLDEREPILVGVRTAAAAESKAYPHKAGSQALEASSAELARSLHLLRSRLASTCRRNEEVADSCHRKSFLAVHTRPRKSIANHGYGDRDHRATEQIQEWNLLTSSQFRAVEPIGGRSSDKTFTSAVRVLSVRIYNAKAYQRQGILPCTIEVLRSKKKASAPPPI